MSESAEMRQLIQVDMLHNGMNPIICSLATMRCYLYRSTAIKFTEEKKWFVIPLVIRIVFWLWA